MSEFKQVKNFTECCKKIKLLLLDCDGVLTDGRIVLGNDGIELKFFGTTDGMGIKLWHDAGFLVGCITGRESGALSKRAQELKFDELYQNIAKKASAYEEVLKKRSLKPDEVAYIGDDVNDLPIGTRAGLFFVPANHHPYIKPFADYVLSSFGGHGAIREAIDVMLSNKGILDEVVARNYLR